LALSRSAKPRVGALARTAPLVVMALRSAPAVSHDEPLAIRPARVQERYSGPADAKPGRGGGRPKLIQIKPEGGFGPVSFHFPKSSRAASAFFRAQTPSDLAGGALLIAAA
jgi:hypothetical protein